MKKFLSGFTALLLTVSLAGCNNGIDTPEYTTAENGTQIINENTAMRAAAEKADLTSEDVKYTSIAYGTTDSGNKYDVGFLHEGYEYSVTIDADSGKIESFEKTEIMGIIDKETALNKAITESGVESLYDYNRDCIKDIEIELDKEDGEFEYEIEFIFENDYVKVYYEIVINAIDGSLKTIEDETNHKKGPGDLTVDGDDNKDNSVEIGEVFSQESSDAVSEESSDIAVEDSSEDVSQEEIPVDKPIEEPIVIPEDSVPPVEENKPSVKDSNLISEKDAYKIALTHSGVDENTIEKLHIDLDRKHGKKEYEIEFISGYTEYDYDIDAVTGEIINFDKEAESCDAHDHSKPSDEEYIGEDAALTATYSHAGVNHEDVSHVEIELEKGKGIFKYEIEFKCGDTEYEYDINALDGSVIQFAKEIDD